MVDTSRAEAYTFSAANIGILHETCKFFLMFLLDTFLSARSEMPYTGAFRLKGKCQSSMHFF